MNRIKKRAIAALVVVALLVSGTAIYLVKYISSGSKWVTFPANRHAYNDGVLFSGEIYDRNGEILASSVDNQRIFSSDRTVRKALLHVIGDSQGNIGTSVLQRFADKLMGYDIINGVYTLGQTPTRLNLTVDAALCETAYDALDGRKGCVLVSNYKTGEILCMVSTPGFDPENPPSADELDDEDAVYVNRALSSSFTPGSIFKLVTLAAAIDTVDDLFERTFECEGECIISDETITCLHEHGTIDIYEALSGSCNCAFAELSQLVGSQKLKEYAHKFGLDENHYVNGIKTASGSIETAADGTAELSWAGIGQHRDLVNPEAVLRMMNAIASGGKGAEPRLIKSATNSLGIPEGIYLTDYTERMISQSTAETLREMMRNNVTEQYGQDRFGELAVCAKSGTAEVGEDKSPHAWFIGFADDSDAPYSFVVFVENGGSGSSAAGGIASKVLGALTNE